jgi:hypothetical protein
MRERKLLSKSVLLIFLIIIVLFLNSCDDATKVSVDERINMFFDDLNAGKTTTIRGDHISPKSTDYSTVSSGYWDTGVWAAVNRPYTVHSSNIPDSNTVTVSVEHQNSAGSFNMVFYMDEDDDDFWLIKGVQGEFGP